MRQETSDEITLAFTKINKSFSLDTNEADAYIEKATARSGEMLDAFLYPYTGRLHTDTTAMHSISWDDTLSSIHDVLTPFIELLHYQSNPDFEVKMIEATAKARDEVIDRGEGVPSKLSIDGTEADAIAYRYSLDAHQIGALLMQSMHPMICSMIMPKHISIIEKY